MGETHPARFSDDDGQRHRRPRARLGPGQGGPAGAARRRSHLMGRPSMGAWVTYGLGSESDNLPGYVVLTAGRGTSAGAQNWASGFLPTSYAGVLFRNQGDPVQSLSNPPGVTSEMQHYGI